MVHCCIASSQLVSDIAWHVLITQEIADEFLRLGCKKDTNNLVLKNTYISLYKMVCVCTHIHIHMHVHTAQTCSEIFWKDMRIWNENTWVCIPALPFTKCLTGGESPAIPEKSGFSSVKWDNSTSQSFEKPVKREHMRKHFVPCKT